MSAYRIPGLALAIIQGDQIIYMHGYGVANPAGEPVTPQIPFLIGSTGKMNQFPGISSQKHAGD